MAAVRVEIVSDLVCPWCFIGKRRFERALDDLRHTKPELEVSVRYRAYQLDPGAPTDRATPVFDTYAKRFGGPQRAAEIIAQVTSVAEAEGIRFDMTRALRANTVRAHRLLKIVGSEAPQLQGPVNEQVMNAYFSGGRDIADPSVLIGCAEAGGFQRPDLEAILRSENDEWSHQIAADLAWAAERDITAVPTFVIDDAMVIPGAQDPATFVRILSKLASR